MTSQLNGAGKQTTSPDSGGTVVRHDAASNSRQSSSEGNLTPRQQQAKLIQNELQHIYDEISRASAVSNAEAGDGLYSHDTDGMNVYGSHYSSHSSGGKGRVLNSHRNSGKRRSLVEIEADIQAIERRQPSDSRRVDDGNKVANDLRGDGTHRSNSSSLYQSRASASSPVHSSNPLGKHQLMEPTPHSSTSANVMDYIPKHRRGRYSVTSPTFKDEQGNAVSDSRSALNANGGTSGSIWPGPENMSLDKRFSSSSLPSVHLDLPDLPTPPMSQQTLEDRTQNPSAQNGDNLIGEDYEAVHLLAKRPQSQAQSSGRQNNARSRQYQPSSTSINISHDADQPLPPPLKQSVKNAPSENSASLASLQSRLEKSEFDKSALQQSLSHQKHLRLEAERRQQDAETRLSQLQQQIESLKQGDAEEQLAEMELRVARMESAVDEANDRAAAADLDASRAGEEKHNAIEELTRAHAECVRLRRRIGELEGQVRSEVGRRESAEAEFRRAQADSRISTDKVAELQNQCSGLASRLEREIADKDGMTRQRVQLVEATDVARQSARLAARMLGVDMSGITAAAVKTIQGESNSTVQGGTSTSSTALKGTETLRAALAAMSVAQGDRRKTSSAELTRRAHIAINEMTALARVLYQFETSKSTEAAFTNETNEGKVQQTINSGTSHVNMTNTAYGTDSEKSGLVYAALMMDNNDTHRGPKENQYHSFGQDDAERELKTLSKGGSEFHAQSQPKHNRPLDGTEKHSVSTVRPASTTNSMRYRESPHSQLQDHTKSTYDDSSSTKFRSFAGQPDAFTRPASAVSMHSPALSYQNSQNGKNFINGRQGDAGRPHSRGYFDERQGLPTSASATVNQMQAEFERLRREGRGETTNMNKRNSNVSKSSSQAFVSSTAYRPYRRNNGPAPSAAPRVQRQLPDGQNSKLSGNHRPMHATQSFFA